MAGADPDVFFDSPGSPAETSPLNGVGSLEKLKSEKHTALLDAIDKLRSHGVNQYDISLPQLIVCGDQSSGKSSVLEGITQLSFPTKDGLCTTFATMLCLREDSNVKIQCTIIPSENHRHDTKLKSFKKTFSSHDAFSFPTVIEEASETMAGSRPAGATNFFDDVLKVEYSSPNLPSLTIIDLPGLIQSQIQGGRVDGVKQVHDLVDKYMRDPKSIILAVVSARNDLENQTIFSKVKAVDLHGDRTLGIITKPDTLDAGSQSEAKFLKLAKNEVFHLKQGWHVVKNRNLKESSFSKQQRDESEKLFFKSGIWSSLPRTEVGIDSLSVKLSKLLLRHIQQELPTIRDAIQHSMLASEQRLSDLGYARETPEQQRSYLVQNAQRFQNLSKDALRGIYQDQFFGFDGPHEHNSLCLRTKIQNLNIAFAHIMFRKGQTWDISDSYDHSVGVGLDGLSSDAIKHYDTSFEDPEHVSRADFLRDHIGKYVRGTRPPGLLSLVNPWVIGAVFRKQSESWEEIAMFHVEEVFQAVKRFIYLALESLLDSRTYSMLVNEQIEPELDVRKRALHSKVKELLVPYTACDPITYDPSWLIELEDVRAKRYAPPASTAFGAFELSHATKQRPSPSRQLLTESFDDFTNSEILDLMQTYYKVQTLFQ